MVDPSANWEDSDEYFLERLKQGSPAAMSDLFDRYGKDINRLVLHFLGSDKDHDDVVQQVFLNVFEGINKVQKASALKSWIVSLTINTVRGEIRKRRFRRRFWSKDEDRRRELRYVDDHGAREAIKRTYMFLDKLAADDRIVFVLRYFEGKTQKEIADACNCSVPTVKRRIKRGETKFLKLASRDPVLADWIERGDRFGGETSASSTSSALASSNTSTKRCPKSGSLHSERPLSKRFALANPSAR